MDNPVVANAQIGLAICAYATCSSTMLVINKLAVHFLPAPAIVLFFQLLSSAVAVFAADKAGLVKSEKLEWSKARTLANWLNCDAHRTAQRCCPAHPRCARFASGDTLTRHIEGGRRRTACLTQRGPALLVVTVPHQGRHDCSVQARVRCFRVASRWVGR